MGAGEGTQGQKENRYCVKHNVTYHTGAPGQQLKTKVPSSGPKGQRKLLALWACTLVTIVAERPISSLIGDDAASNVYDQIAFYVAQQKVTMNNPVLQNLRQLRQPSKQSWGHDRVGITLGIWVVYLDMTL